MPDRSSLLDASDEGRISFSVRQKSFLVLVEAGAKKKKKHLFVVKKTVGGEDDVATVLRLARGYWNQFDISGEPRYGASQVQ